MSKKSDEAQRYRALRLIESLSGRDPPTIDRLLGSPHRDVRDAALRHPGLSREVWYSRLSRLDSTAAWDNPVLDLEMVTGRPVGVLKIVYRRLSGQCPGDAQDFVRQPGVRTILSWTLRWWRQCTLTELVRFSAEFRSWSNHEFFPCTDLMALGEPPAPEQRKEAALRAQSILLNKKDPVGRTESALRTLLPEYITDTTEPCSPWEHWIRALSKTTKVWKLTLGDREDRAVEVVNHLISAGYNLTAETFRARFPYPPANAKEILWREQMDETNRP